MKKLTRILILALLLLVVPGCSLINIRRPDIYKNNLKGMPQKKEISFEEKQQLKATATAAYQKSEEIYYKGTEPESEVAKFVKEATFRIMAWVGPVISKYNLDTAEDLDQFIEKTNKALEESQKKNYEYEKKEKEWKHQLATKDNLVKSAKSKLKGFKASVFSGVWAFVIIFILALLVMGIIQAWTGIPVLTMFLGGVRKVFGGARQLVKGVQDFRQDLKDDIAVEKDSEKKKMKEEMLAKMDAKLSENQDEATKKLVRKIKDREKKKNGKPDSKSTKRSS